MNIIPIKKEKVLNEGSVENQVWNRINAFLSLKSKNTQITYIGIIKEWCEFLGGQAGSPEAAEMLICATDLHVVAYRKWLEQRPGQRPRYMQSYNKCLDLEPSEMGHCLNDGYQSTQANATVAKKFAALRRIYRMLISINIGISVNPFDPDIVPSPSAKSGQKRPTEMLNFSLVKKVIEIPVTDQAGGIRDKAALSLLFGCGLRRSEVVALKLCDLCQSVQGTPYIRLRATKNKKDANQPLPNWVNENVEVLKNQRLNEGADVSDPLFVSYRGSTAKNGHHVQMTANGLYKMFKMYCLKAGVGSFITPHSARATAITKLLSDGVDHREVQEFSRHSSIQMVENYDKRRYKIEDNPGRKIKY